MKIDSDVFHPAVQLPKVVGTKRMALLLDVDGTLLDIAATPNSVVVSLQSPREVRSWLASLAGRSEPAP